MIPHILLPAAGELRGAYEDVDWAATPLGPVEAWTPALRNAVDLALGTRFPVTLFWGPEFAMVYNAAYVALIGDKHPSVPGAPAREVFPEAWDVISPMMESVLDGEGANWVEDERVPLIRRGRLEEAYFTVSYSAVRGPDGAIEGLMDIATETARQVIDRRRLQTLGRLREVLAATEGAGEILERALEVLRADPADFPSAALRPALAQVEPLELVDDLARLALGPRRIGRGVLEVQLSAHLEPDAGYLGYLRLVASAIGQALDRVDAREPSAASRSRSSAAC